MNTDQPEEPNSETIGPTEKEKSLDLSKTADLLYVQPDFATIENWRQNKVELEKVSGPVAYVLGQDHAIMALNWLLSCGFAPEEIVERLNALTQNRNEFMGYASEDLGID